MIDVASHLNTIILIEIFFEEQILMKIAFE